MNRQRNRSKASRRKGWPYAGLRATTAAEREAEWKRRADRLAATKKNSHKKRLQAKHTPPKETAKLKAERAAKAMEAARKVFEAWLVSNPVQVFAKMDQGALHPRGSSSLARHVYAALKEALPEPDPKPEA